MKARIGLNSCMQHFNMLLHLLPLGTVQIEGRPVKKTYLSPLFENMSSHDIRPSIGVRFQAKVEETMVQRLPGSTFTHAW